MNVHIYLSIYIYQPYTHARTHNTYIYRERMPSENTNFQNEGECVQISSWNIKIRANVSTLSTLNPADVLLHRNGADGSAFLDFMNIGFRVRRLVEKIHELSNRNFV